MNEYTAVIEALDQKMGRPVTMDHWKRIADKPGAALTDDDIAVCGFFGGPSSAAAARARREQALAPLPPPDPPAAVKKHAAAVQFPDRLWDDAAADPVATIKTWADTHAMKATPIALWHLGLVAGRKKRERLEEKVVALEAEIEKLKARPLQKWAGVHIEGMPYSEASLVTKGGSLWAATTATTTTPGAPGSDWRLIVKNGGAR